MAYTTINKGSDYFNTKLYTGNGGSSTDSITGINFQPDLVWIKARNNAYNHNLYDSVRGLSSGAILSNSTAAQDSIQRISSLDSDGFTLPATLYTYVNASGTNYASWNWLANGAGSSNTDGNGNNVLVSANTTSGFSIVQGDMNASGSWTFGHGLGVAPSMIILRGQTVTSNWYVYHKSLGAGTRLFLNTTDASTSDTTFMDNTTPTANVFSMNAGTWSAGAGTKIIAYCFAEKKGFSKFGSYAGNGSADGPFIYTGFKPAFIVTKDITTAYAWIMYDSVRASYNLTTNRLFPHLSDAEVTTTAVGIDLLSNGFKIRNNNVQQNGSGDTFIYMAFAEHPLVSSTGTPCTAR